MGSLTGKVTRRHPRQSRAREKSASGPVIKNGTHEGLHVKSVGRTVICRFHRTGISRRR